MEVTNQIGNIFVLSKIDGVSLHKLKQFHDERGKVMHMLRSNDSQFEKFVKYIFLAIIQMLLRLAQA